MNRLLFPAVAAATVAIAVATAAHAAGPAPPTDAFAEDAAACAALQGRSLGPGRVAAATFIRQPYVAEWSGWLPSRVPIDTPHCRLEGIADPTPRSHIVFEVWLPSKTRWNGRLLGVGAGGSSGALNNVLLAIGLNRGFVTVATDNGHRSPSGRDDNSWALGEPERVVDFGYRANHLATQAAKAAVLRFYRHVPQYAYFYGCSQGGQKGMMEAQRFPGDYDGIVAGAPVYSWVSEMTQQAWNVRALTETQGSALSIPQMRALHDAALKHCAAPGGLVMDPRHCDFDPASLLCPQAEGAACLTPEQVSAAAKIYDGPRTSDGTRIYPGFARGSELEWQQLYAKVSPDGSSGGGSFLGVFRHMVYDDPAWTLRQFNAGEDWAYAKRKVGPMLDPDSPDIDAFVKRGGRLIIYHGWADQQVPPQSSLDYLAAVTARSRGEPVEGFMRLFMIPGMPHCFLPAPGPNLVLQADNPAGAPVTSENDVLTALQRWVEHGEAPEQFTVHLQDEGRDIASRTVRVCREPLRAVFAGSGDPLDAANWRCDAAAH